MVTIDEARDLLGVVADHFGLYGKFLSVQTGLTRDLGADDIDRRELLATIEELFEIRFTAKQSNELDVVEDIVEAINSARLSVKST